MRHASIDGYSSSSTSAVESKTSNYIGKWNGKDQSGVVWAEELSAPRAVESILGSDPTQAAHPLRVCDLAPSVSWKDHTLSRSSTGHRSHCLGEHSFSAYPWCRIEAEYLRIPSQKKFHERRPLPFSEVKNVAFNDSDFRKSLVIAITAPHSS